MSKKKVIATSVLSLAMCGSLVAGATFALFTSESQTNVAIQSGTVDVVATLTDLKLYSMGVERDDLTFQNGGTAKLEEGNLELSLMTPGDKATFNVVLNNESNVSVKYRTIIESLNDTGLFEGLDVSIDGATYDGSEKITPWATLQPNEEIEKDTISVVVELPEDAGNEYQNKATDIAVTVEAVQANASTGASVNGTSYETLNEALENAKEGDVIQLNDNVSFDFGTGSNQTIDGKGVIIRSYASATTFALDSAEQEEHTITFVGDGANNVLSNVKIENAIVVDKTTSYAEDSWEIGYLELKDITATNVVFNDGVMLDGESTFTGCTFTGKTDNMQMYGAWVRSGNATFEGCTFVGTRGLKAHETYGSEIATLTVDGCLFDGMTEKPGIALGTLNAATTVSITNNKFIGTQAGDQGLYSYETDTTVDTFDFTYDNNEIVYVFDTAAELTAFGKVVNDGNDFAGVSVCLAADIDLKGESWTPIANFAGTLDGQGYTISNLTANLFNTVSGTVKNVNVKNVNVLNTTKGGANGFIKTVSAGGLVDNCKVFGVDIQWADGIWDMTDGFGGVICSVSAGATVQDCEFSDISLTTYAKTKRTGGVFDGISGTVKGCTFNNVEFTVVENNGEDAYISHYAGGLAACVAGNAIVEDCKINNMQVNVCEAYNHLGGIFGKAQVSGSAGKITLKNITVNGLTMNVGNTAEGMACVAGFIAQPDSRSNDIRATIDNCHIYDLDMTLASSKQGESAAAGFISGLCGGVDAINCSVSGKIDGTKATVNVGGFIGDAGWYGSIEQNFTNCVANVDITVKNSIAGGFIAVNGTLSGGTANLNFTDCQASGSVIVVDGGTGTADPFCGKTIE